MRPALLGSLLLALLLAGCSDSSDAPDGDGGGDGDDADGPGEDAGATSSASASQTSTAPPPGAGGGGAPTTHQSVMRNNLFVPADLTVRVGDTVRWTTEDPQAHNVVSDSEAATFRSEDVSIVPLLYGQEFSHTFDTAGSVDYLCEYHSGMVGTITVVA